MINRQLSMIGLAAKANALVSGEFAVERSVKKYKAILVIIATDASDNTKKKFCDICKYRNIPTVFLSNKEELGRILGKQYRAVIAITDKNFAKALQEKI